MGFAVSVQDTHKLESAANPLLPECGASLNAAYFEDASNENGYLIQNHLQPFQPALCFKGQLCQSLAVRYPGALV